jgi:hypothetical protein
MLAVSGCPSHLGTAITWRENLFSLSSIQVIKQTNFVLLVKPTQAHTLQPLQVGVFTLPSALPLAFPPPQSPRSSNLISPRDRAPNHWLPYRWLPPRRWPCCLIVCRAICFSRSIMMLSPSWQVRLAGIVKDNYSKGKGPFGRPEAGDSKTCNLAVHDVWVE